MTGFKFSWRISKPPLIAKVDEIGRTIRPPRLKVEDQSDIFKVSLATPKDLQQTIGQGHLVIELNLETEDWSRVEANVFKLFKLLKIPEDAKAHCESLGTQLASIHSKWEQQLAEEAVDGDSVWLGGRYSDNQWQWVDNSSWGFTNWRSDCPRGRKFLRMTQNGVWVDYKNSKRLSNFLCQKGSIILTNNTFRSFEFSAEQLKFFPFNMLFKSQAMPMDPKFSNSSIAAVEKIRYGFTINWFLKDENNNILTKKLPARAEDWMRETPNYKQPLLMKMVRLAHYLRTTQNMTKEQILDKVIQEKIQHINILEEPRRCSMDQIKYGYLEGSFSQLVSFVEEKDQKEPLTDMDVNTGFEIFHAIVYCPVKDLKLFRFVDRLLTLETSRTIIQTIVNLFHHHVIKDPRRYMLTKKFYLRLAATLDMQYGKVLLASSTKAQLQAVIDNDWPFFTNLTDVLKTCLYHSNCENLQEILQEQGEKILIIK